MTKRYFKATDGTYTFFRASESRTYRYGWIALGQSTRRAADGKTWEKYGEAHPLNLGFSNHKVGGAVPAIEIGKDEYAALVAIKTKRIDAWREEMEAKGHTHFSSASPGDSWVRNDELEADTAA